MQDLITPNVLLGKFRKDWGTQNMSTMDHAGGPRIHTVQQNVNRKIQSFVDRAVYPQQLTLPRQYATTEEGTRVYKILVGRVIDGVQEQGVRVIVQENAKMARFVVSPLFSNQHDALDWARQHMGATHGNI